MPANYFAEPQGLPFDEEVLKQQQEEGWHWKEFRFTSLIYGGEAIRIHAVYAVPDGTDKNHRVPGVLMTHGVFGSIFNNPPYWGALSTLVKSGYAVLFFDWYPDFAHNAKPNDPKSFTTFGKLDYFGDEHWFRKGDDFKESIHYQVVMAGKRAVTWMSTQSEVDARKIGVTGASYGGIFSSLIAAVEPRIKAAAPTVYTSGFGLKEESYNRLPPSWSEQEAETWRNRFDSKGLLAKRKIPILYTVGTNDTAFWLSKVMDIFGAMNEPKHLLIGPNQGHGYWDFEQTILFFDHALKNKMPRLRATELTLRRDKLEAVASVKVAGKPAKVEICFSPNFELDPDGGAASISANVWNWKVVEAKPTTPNEYSARLILPVMRPLDANEKFYDWRDQEIWKPATPSERSTPATPSADGRVQAFARVTDQFGAMECTPLASPLAFSDQQRTVKPLSNESLPILSAAARVAAPTPIVLDPNAPAGKPRASLPVGLPQTEVGTRGYVLWNWRQQPPSEKLITENAATPTIQIFEPFKNTIPTTSFRSPAYDYNARGGFLNFSLNGKTDNLIEGHAWHGALPIGNGATEEIPISTTDDEEHVLTLVMPAIVLGECNVRVWLRDESGHAAIVRYRQTAKADAVLQFRFKGKAHLGAQITSQPTWQFHALVGPSALFFD